MIKNRLEGILEENDFSIYKLAQQAGIRYATIHSFVKNKTQSADYKVLDRICKVLSITPGDILEYIPEEEQKE